jgi:pimeloyl-ACP methyl ester carboxylesterase
MSSGILLAVSPECFSLVAVSRSRSGWDTPAWAERKAVSLEIIDGCGHLIMLEDSEGFARPIVDVLERP